MLIFLAFILLVGLTAIAPFAPAGENPTAAADYRTKPLQDWLLDGAGLCVQGLLIPLLQITVIYRMWGFLLPDLQGALALGIIPSFLLSFVGVDYLYYWNHRLLHTGGLWPIHQVHHSVTQMDVLGTSRNTLWSSFFIVYLWIHALFLYGLANPGGYILGVSLTSALDLWRHSQFSPLRGTWAHRFLSPWLILPEDHAQHHSAIAPACNFGANLKLWDWLHGTLQTSDTPPKHLGRSLNLTLNQQLLFPFQKE